MVGWMNVTVGFIICQRITELYIGRCNEKWATKVGGQEFGKSHYPLFFLLHIGWLVGWVLEFHLNGAGISEGWYFWLSLFVLAQGLRYWCIISLGQLWNTRILVIPGMVRVKKGPYRFLNHPNYIAVAVELFSVPLLFDATITAVFATLLNGALLLGIRIPEEEKALQLLRVSVGDSTSNS